MPPSNTQDPQALVSEYYAKYSQEILAFFRHTRRMTMTDAGDMMQQTFTALLTTWRNNPTMTVDKPRALLFKIASLQFANYIDGQVRRGHRVTGDGTNDRASQAESDDLQFQATLRAEQKLLLRAMRRLTDEDDARATAAHDSGELPTTEEVSQYQLILYFRFWVGLKLPQVAEIFDIPVGTLSGRQRRALALLRARVDQLDVPSTATRRTSTTVLDRWRAVLEQDAQDLLPSETG